jgi:4,5-dihydroxyphthalate decarboxylase
MGHDYCPYGVEANLHALNTFLRYSYERGLSEKQLAPTDIFAPEMIYEFKKDIYSPIADFTTFD